MLDAQIDELPDFERYWSVSDREVQVQVQGKLRALALTPSHLLPLRTVEDYLDSVRIRGIPPERSLPAGMWPIPDNRTMSQYLKEKEAIDRVSAAAVTAELDGVEGHPTPVLISDYMEILNDTVAAYLRAVGDA